MSAPALRRALVLWGPPAAYVGGIFYLSSLPDVPWVSTYPDYLLHPIEYAGLAILTARSLNGGLRPRPTWPRIVAAFVLCAGLGALDEWFQSGTPGRQSDPLDVVKDAAGAVLGLATFALLQAALRRGRSAARGGAAGDEARLFARQGCPPCFALKRRAARAARRHGLVLRVIDVDSDQSLRAAYGDRVPVLVLPEGSVLQGKAGAAEIDAAFRAAAARSRRGDSGPG